jgi:hypothetical protein
MKDDRQKEKTMRNMFGILFCLILVAAPAGAGPSFQGYSGLINIPTADSLDAGEYNFAGFLVEGDKNAAVGAANAGLLAGLEMGVTYEKKEGERGETLINGKYNFMSEGLVLPEMAVGVADISDQLDMSPYFVMSKSITGPLNVLHKEIINPRLHLGVGSGRFDGVFGGVSVGLGKIASLMAEYDSKKMNAGLRFTVSPSVQLHIAGMNDFKDFAVGLSYNKRL